MNTPQRL